MHIKDTFYLHRSGERCGGGGGNLIRSELIVIDKEKHNYLSRS